jgi:hypothetical protein
MLASQQFENVHIKKSIKLQHEIYRYLAVTGLLRQGSFFVKSRVHYTIENSSHRPT